MTDETQAAYSFDDLARKVQDAAIQRYASIGIDKKWYEAILGEYRALGEKLGVAIAQCNVTLPETSAQKHPSYEIEGNFDSSKIDMDYQLPEKFLSLSQSRDLTLSLLSGVGSLVIKGDFRVDTKFSFAVAPWMGQEKIDPKPNLSRSQFQSYRQAQEQILNMVGEFLDSVREEWQTQYQEQTSRTAIKKALKELSFTEKGIIIEN